MSRRAQARARAKYQEPILVVSGLVITFVVLALTAWLISVSDRSGGNRLGHTTFELNASFAARQVREQGPVLYPDLLGRQRNLYLQHLSDDPQEGWYAFRAAAPGARPECVLTWEPGPRMFRDPCDGRQFPADGAGLDQYRVTVEQDRGEGTRNKLVVSLRHRPDGSAYPTGE